MKALSFRKMSVLTVCMMISCLLLINVSPVYSGIVQTAVAVTVAGDYTSGAHSSVSVDPVGGPRTYQNNLLPSISDMTIEAYGRYFYRIERLYGDNISKFDMNAPDQLIWQFSAMNADEEGNSNPHGIAFVNAEKAYLFRMGSTTAWIINPSATKQSEFKIGELDLSAYADSDGNPEMHAGIIAKGKLFICLKRQDRDNSWDITNTAYIAVFDITTDKEINTGIANNDGVLGIPLPIKNPASISYLAENDTIYVQGCGRYKSKWSGKPAVYESGVVSIDPDSYETRMVLDDDTNGDGVPLYGGNISGMAILSPTKGYFTTYAESDECSVRSFNPSTGIVGNVVAGLENKGISGMDAGVYFDKNNMLWVCNHTDARLDIINTATDTIDESIPTNLNPSKVVFCEESSGGYQVTPDLWIRAVIHTAEKGDIEAFWKESGREKTTGGDEVIYGHFYATPTEVNWGSANNPDLFVKIWFDRTGRLDVNFFHVSVPEITVYSAYPSDGTPDNQDTATMDTRYIRHTYEKNK